MSRRRKSICELLITVKTSKEKNHESESAIVFGRL